MSEKLTPFLLESILREIQKTNESSASARHILFQGQARKILPALVNISQYTPVLVSILESFKRNPFIKIHPPLFQVAFNEIEFLKTKYKGAKPSNTSDTKNNAKIHPKTSSTTISKDKKLADLPTPTPTPTPTPKDARLASSNLTYRYSLRPKPDINNPTILENSPKEIADSNEYQIFIPLLKEKNLSSVKIIKDWLNYKKNIPFDLTKDDIYRNEENGKHVSCKISTIGEKDLLYLILIEKTSNLEFHTEALISTSEDDSWIWIKSESNEDKMAMPPSFVSDLIDLSYHKDKIIKSKKHNYISSETDVDNLARYMEDPERILPLFIIATNSSAKDFNFVSRAIGKWSKSLVGIGEIYLLNQKSSAYFIDKYSNEYFQVYPWAIRVINPSFSFSDNENKAHHRFIGPRKILNKEHEKSNVFLLGRIARSIYNQREIPRKVYTAKNDFTLKSNREMLFLQEESKSLISRRAVDKDRALQLPYSYDVSAQILTSLKEASDLIGIKNIDADLMYSYAEAFEDREKFSNHRNEIFDLLQEKQSLISEIEQENYYYKSLIEEFEDDKSDLEDKIQRLERQIEYLQNEIVSSGSPEKAFQFDYSDNSPASFEDLYDLLQDQKFQFIKFTGDPKKMLLLDELDTKSKAIKSVWRTLCCLNDYGRFKNENASGNIRSYLIDPPHGYQTVSAKNYAQHESSTTQNQYAEDRLFPIPASEEFPSGKTYMWSHFKINASGFGTKIPRLHFYDDTDNNRIIYVGYIGPHLKVGSTN